MSMAAQRPTAALYETDDHAWALEQAALLRAGRTADLDAANLAEELEDLARAWRDAVGSHLETVIEHLLKLEWSPAADPRDGWAVTVATHRARLEDRLTPTLRRHLDDTFAKRYARARRIAARSMRRDGVTEATLPATCPYTLDQILDPDFEPPNRHGLAP